MTGLPASEEENVLAIEVGPGIWMRSEGVAEGTAALQPLCDQLKRLLRLVKSEAQSPSSYSIQVDRSAPVES
jgi:hypothetical protein